MAPKTVAPSHPSYQEMIKQTLVALKERHGSSLAAVKKYIGANFKLPQGWEKNLSVQLKKFVASGKLVKVKASYKLGEPLKKEPKPAKKPATAIKPQAKAPVKPKAKEIAVKGEKKKKVPAAEEKKKAPARPKKAAADEKKKPAAEKKKTPAKKAAVKKTTATKKAAPQKKKATAPKAKKAASPKAKKTINPKAKKA